MKKFCLPVAILAMSILPILAALKSAEKVSSRHPDFQLGGYGPSPVCMLAEGFDNVGNLIGNGWFMQNNSMPLGGTGWFQGNPALFTSQSGAPNSYIAADFNNGSGVATISNWLLTPTLQLQNGGVLIFWTRTVTPGAQLFPDRLQVRMSTNGSSTDVGGTATSVGDFTTLLLDINPTYADDYPHVWTQYTVTISGLPSPTTGRLAFRYFVEDGGPSGTRSDYIGIDTMAYMCPPPTPTPTPTPTPAPTPTPTPTLGNYPATSIVLSTDTTVTPDASPTNAASISVYTLTNFKGTLEGSPITGVVRVTDAHPAGTYTVTVKAFNGALIATKTFTLTVTTPVTCIPISFGAPTNFSTDGIARPYSVAVGDFNGDGNQDLAVAGYRGCCGGAVAILLGDGTGNFDLTPVVGAGVNPVSVAVGDFNGDGKQDLAVVNLYSNNVSIFLGNGAGGFSAATNFATGTTPYSVAVGDFNGDGKQDLAMANFGSNNVSILIGNGDGTFIAATNFNVANHPISVAVGDFNGDGNQDVAVVNNGGPNKVSILLGNGAGGFSSPNAFPVGNVDPISVAVGDFNGDGKQDLAVANNVADNVSILLRNCTLSPTTAVSRNTHGGAGTFDINLPLAGSPGIECRTSGRTTNDYTIIVTFPSAVTVDGNPQAAVTLGAGCVGSGGACSGSVNVSGNTVTIPLTNVPNAQTINVTLYQVDSGGNVVIPMAVLAGDVNGNRTVNAADVAFTKAHIGQSVDATNFRADVNFNGTINASDVSLVKSYLGTGLP